MIMFMDGFEQFKDGTTTDLAQAGYAPVGTLSLADGRTSNSVCVAIGGDPDSSISRTFTSGANRVILAFAYKGDTSREDIVSIDNAFKLEWPDKLQINGSKGAVIPVIGLWYYFELVMDRAAQTIEVYVNNVKDLTVAMPAAMQNLNTWKCTWPSPAKATKRLDDLFFITSGNPNPVDRVGPQAISIRIPTQDVTKEWSAATGDDHFAMVDNRPPVETQYIQSAVSGAQDLFLSGATGNGKPITAVGVVVRARKSDIDNRQIGIAVGAKAGPQKETLVSALLTTPTYNYAVFPTDPAGATWTDSSVLDTPFGVVVRP